MAAKVPEHLREQPELVAAVIDARRVEMETDDPASAIEWLLEHYPMSPESARRVIEDETFRFVALYPDGHPGLQALIEEQKAKSRRSYNLRKLRPQVVERDDSRCQYCGKRVVGSEGTLDHKDPEGPATLENIHLLCRTCNTHKGRRSWDDFLKAEEEWKARLQQQQDARPDFICEQTGLSVKGRSWKEAGCLSPEMCRMMRECDNGGYAEFEAEMDERVNRLIEASET